MQCPAMKTTTTLGASNWSLSRRIVRSLPRLESLFGGRLHIVEGIVDRIINYELVGLHRDAEIREFIGEFDGRAMRAVTRNTTVSR